MTRHILVALQVESQLLDRSNWPWWASHGEQLRIKREACEKRQALNDHIKLYGDTKSKGRLPAKSSNPLYTNKQHFNDQ